MSTTDDEKSPPAPAVADTPPKPAPQRPMPPLMPKEVGGPKGPEPTRFGDWEQKGRATDF